MIDNPTLNLSDDDQAALKRLGTALANRVHRCGLPWYEAHTVVGGREWLLEYRPKGDAD